MRTHFSSWRRGNPHGPIIALLALSISGCGNQSYRAEVKAVGDPAQGAVVINRYSCGSCHEIPGINLAHGLVGPPLKGFGKRVTIAGVLPNTPDNLVKWIRFPQEVVPGNAMPDSGLSEAQARDVAAYLYTLR